jgi:hypothetical protein
MAQVFFAGAVQVQNYLYAKGNTRKNKFKKKLNFPVISGFF